MTKAAQAFGKQMVHFWSNKTTDEYLLALHDSLTGNHRNSDELNGSAVRDAQDALTERKRGGTEAEGGTWGHPKLAVFFARWLDVRFAVYLVPRPWWGCGGVT